MRDDFSQKAKDILAKRVGFVCSNPDCRMHTIGPNSDVSKCTSVGVAAHVTAASQGGPRFNPDLTSNERGEIGNGIWLCQSCARLIDSDPGSYPVDRLLHWKAAAEQEAAVRLNRQMRSSPGVQHSEVQELQPNGYYEHMLDGCKVRFFLDAGNNLHCEQEFENGAIAYCVVDEGGNIVDLKLPYPLEEYSLEVDPSLLLRKSIEHLGNGQTREVFELKWGKRAVLIRDPRGRICDIRIERGVRMDHIRRVFIIEAPLFKKTEEKTGPASLTEPVVSLR